MWWEADWLHAELDIRTPEEPGVLAAVAPALPPGRPQPPSELERRPRLVHEDATGVRSHGAAGDPDCDTPG